ncbi:uncharacterized protein [Mytilus edulis]|uniref:uncharacterized protein n=1 Tax=Mytilus edulis TaxID=6550 RepID=UPI0039EF4613
MVGCRALGLFNKFITSPLWKILEGDIHILHMNQKYQQLVQFLEDISTDVEKIKLFMTGELVPFPSVDVKKDEIWASLVSNHNDEQCAAFLIQMCSATSKALSQKVKDHLEDGQHTQYGIDRSKTFNSVLPHNKLPEFIFGHLDWLIKHRPNASRLANEAHIVYNVNKTGAWLNRQTEQNVQELINRSKLKIKDIKITEKQRLLDLKNELERISREKKEKAKRILIKKCNEKKKLVEHILKLGLWDNARKVDQELTKIKFIKNKREILKTQIKFRQLVFEQPGEKTLFQVSQANKKPVTISQLTKNLKTLIKKLVNAAVPTQILEHTIAEDLHDFGKSFLFIKIKFRKV